MSVTVPYGNDSSAVPSPPTSTDRADAVATAPDHLLRLIVAILADEIGRQRRRAVDRAEWAQWTGETVVDEDGVGVDSLARLELVGRFSRFFRLHLSGLEDHLLIRRRLIDWAEIALEGLRRQPTGQPVSICFQTSGSTGLPRTVSHGLDSLMEEVSGLGSCFAGSRRVVSLVPPHHIYGFLFGLLLPRHLLLPLADHRGRAPGAILRALEPGDLVVATPFLWDLLADCGVAPPQDVTGVSSGAQMSAELWDRLARRGFGSMVEVYGSTETAGLGLRSRAGAPFEALPHLVLRPGPPVRLCRRGDGRPLDPPDRLAPAEGGGFVCLGRIDGAVQVGGINVFPASVAERIRSRPEVADCAVRLDPAGAAARLKALVVPREGVPSCPAQREALVARLRKGFRTVLEAPEQPAEIALAARLPRDGMGKLTDWA